MTSPRSGRWHKARGEQRTPGTRHLIDVQARGAGDGPRVSSSQGYRPLRGLQFVWYRVTRGSLLTPGVYAIVRSADWVYYKT